MQKSINKILFLILTIALFTGLADFPNSISAATIDLNWKTNTHHGITEINVGDQVCWTWTDSFTHSVTSGVSNVPDGLFDSGFIAGLETQFCHTFNDVGDFPYFCEIHGSASMDGTIRVLEPDSDDDGVPDSSDNCPSVVNTNQLDMDNDTDGDACDDENIITTNTILSQNTISLGDVVVQGGAVITINSGITLDIDFENHKLLVQSGSGVLIKAGGTIT